MTGNIVRVPPELPARLRKERERRYLTQAELAEKAGVHARTVYELESGRRDRILAKTVMLLAEALGISVDELIYGLSAPEVPIATGESCAPQETSPGHIRKILAISIVPMVVLLLVVAFYHYQTINLLGDTQNRRLEARDGLFGRVIWTREFDDQILFSRHAGWSDDILLVGLAGLTHDGGRLVALDRNSGEEIWSLAPDREEMAAAFGQPMVYGGGFGCREVLEADLAGDGEPELIVHFGHTKWFPNALCVAGRDGRRIAQYANKGSLYDIAVVDLNGDGCDEVLAAGTNNTPDYQGATVFLLDADHWKGAAVDTFTQPGCAVRDSALYRLVLPAWPEPYMKMLDIQRLEASKVLTFRNGAGEVVIQVDVGVHEIGAMVLDLDSRLVPLGIDASDNFISLLRRAGLEDDARARGILDPEVREAWLDRYLHFQVGQLTGHAASH